jgi:phosphatidate cytidylyltransferase
MDALRGHLLFWLASAASVIVAGGVFGNVGVIVLFGIVSLQTLREFLTLTHTRRSDHWALAAAFFIVTPFQYLLIAVDWYGLASIMVPVYAFLGLPIVAVVRGDTTRFMARIAEVQWGLMTCVYCIAHVPALLMLKIEGFDGSMLWLILFLGLVVQGAAFVSAAAIPWLGLADARRSLAEAAVTAIAGAVLGSALCAATPFSMVQAAALGSIVSVLGLAGSLVLDAVKRDRGVEDWRRAGGTGLGGCITEPGLLDRLERIVFASPVFFHLVRYWWVD